VIKKTLFKGKFRACSLYLHNMKSIELTDFEGFRLNNFSLE
jgi:hypothetical protein